MNHILMSFSKKHLCCIWAPNEKEEHEAYFKDYWDVLRCDIIFYYCITVMRACEENVLNGYENS